MKKKNIIFGILLYAVTSAVSYFIFSNTPAASILGGETPLSVEDAKLVGDRVVFDPNLPKTQECPINGAKYSKQQEKWWSSHRPLGVMIENHEEARPQSGISYADVVYEAVAEGGITRFLSVFYCQDAGMVGPVRSARTYFLDFISEYGSNPLYAHVGGANTPGPADAISQIEEYGWAVKNDLNQFSIGFPTFWRDYNRLGRTVATEHTMYSTTDKLWTYARESRELTDKDDEGNSWDETFRPYKFKEDASSSGRGNVDSLHLEFWEGYSQYFVDWAYDRPSNTYKRSHGQDPHLDKNTNQQIRAKNIVVLSMEESRANDGYAGNAHLLYDTQGTGEAYIFMDGRRINGTWRKDGRTKRTMLYDESGDEIKLNRGLIWFEILPTTGVITAS